MVCAMVIRRGFESFERPLTRGWEEFLNKSEVSPRLENGLVRRTGHNPLPLSRGSESGAVCANTPGKVAGRHLGRIIAREGPLSRPQEPTEDRGFGDDPN